MMRIYLRRWLLILIVGLIGASGFRAEAQDQPTFTPSLSPTPQTQRIFAIAWSPDGNNIAYTTNNGITQVIDARTKQVLFTVQSDRDGSTIQVVWSPDGTKLATGGVDEVVHIWSSPTGLLLNTLPHRLYADAITGLAWHSDGTKLVQASYSGDITVWDMTSNQIQLSIVSPASVGSISLNQDGNKLAATDGNVIDIWSLANGQVISEFVGHTGEIISVAWKPHADVVASAALDNTIYMWDASTGQTIQTFIGHTNVITTLSWSPDGTKLASSSQDDTIRIWNASTGSTPKQDTRIDTFTSSRLESRWQPNRLWWL